MKNKILTSVIVAAISLMSFVESTEHQKEIIIKSEIGMKEITFGVRGNCGMCKKTIEKAAMSVKGVKSAIWDVEKKKIDISFDDVKTNEMAIHKAIAASGYDTDKVESVETAYNKLPGCCQYDHEMEMNQ